MTKAQQDAIKAAQDGLRRAQVVFTTPGVTLGIKRNVPLYSADPDNPDIIIRKLNGKRERGRVTKDGVFRVCAKRG